MEYDPVSIVRDGSVKKKLGMEATRLMTGWEGSRIIERICDHDCPRQLAVAMENTSDLREILKQ